MKFWAAFLVLLSFASAQTPATSPVNAPAPLQTYTNQALGLTFSYPAELHPIDGAGAVANGRRMVLGEMALPSAQPSQQPDTCTKTLLALGTKPGPESGKARSGVAAMLTLFDIDLRCLPPKAAKNKSLLNTTMRGFASQGVTELGMMPINEPVAYRLAGQRAYFAASQGTPVESTELQSGQSEVIAVITVAANQHILAWMLESNDLDVLNRMFRSQVAFGPGPPQQLFPTGLQGDSGLAGVP
jgi:hypothetical protein